MASKPAVKVTSEAVREALRLRYPAESHALMFEVADSTGFGRHRFADAIAVSLWASHGHKIEGIEIKVSRSDFLQEMKQPQKSQPIYQYCHRWWLACPKDMVKPEELPPGWGLLELHDGGTMRKKVEAAKLEPVPLSIEFVASMMRRKAGRDEDMAKVEISLQVHKQVREIEARLRMDAETANRGAAHDAELAMENWRRIYSETGIDFTKYGVGEEIVKAVQMMRKLGTGWHAPLKDLLKASREVHDTIAASGLLEKEPTEGKSQWE